MSVVLMNSSHQFLKMNVGQQAFFPLLCVALSCVVLCCTAPPVLHGASYNDSLHLAKFTRTRVQHLLGRYKEQQLGDKHFEDRSLQMRALPLLSTDFNSWLKLTASERLCIAFRNLQTYWDMLEWKRGQLGREEVLRRQQEALNGTKPTLPLPDSIQHIQLDLRDLMRQVTSQMRVISGTKSSDTAPAASRSLPSSRPLPSRTLWTSRLEGYIILRDLDLYLTKLARDFLLLSSKDRNNH